MPGVLILSNGTCSALPSGSSVVIESLHVTFIWIFNGLQIFGFIALTTLTLTAFFSSHIKRAATWYTFMIGWIFWCISYFALIGQQTGDCPGFGFCLFQAALIYAGPPANACASLAILLQLRLSMNFDLYGSGNQKWQSIMLIAAPPVVYILVFIATLVYGLLNAAEVQRDPTGMYCNLANGIPTKISAGLVAMFCIAMLIYEVRTFRMLYKNRSALRSLQAQRRSSVPVTMIVRISIFSFLPILALGLSVFAVVLTNGGSTENILSNIMTASLSGAAALIFGTQQDLLHAMIFCRRRKVKTVPNETAAQKGVSICVSVSVEDKDIV
ncbi:MAG: hypothetical protein NXY57DRAFT_1031988 [Lentinula lateritia]|nr:MAG: hypothetical protein NXY57DRAFT_1031988 [Lentinula lateritia]